MGTIKKNSTLYWVIALLAVLATGGLVYQIAILGMQTAFFEVAVYLAVFVLVVLNPFRIVVTCACFLEACLVGMVEELQHACIEFVKNHPYRMEQVRERHFRGAQQHGDHNTSLDPGPPTVR